MRTLTSIYFVRKKHREEKVLATGKEKEKKPGRENI